MLVRTYKKTKRKIKDVRAYRNVLSSDEHHRYQVVVNPSDSELLHEAKKLHATTYLSRDFVSQDSIENEILSSSSDPHQHHAVYFLVLSRNKDCLALSRQIHHEENKSFESFPIMQKASIYVRQQKFIEKHDPNKIVEISALVKKRGESGIIPLLLYKAMWKYSLEQGHDLWLMACDVRLYERLKLLFGDTIKQIGKRTQYQGGEVVPAMVFVRDALDDLMHTTKRVNLTNRIIRRKVVNFMLSDN